MWPPMSSGSQRWLSAVEAPAPAALQQRIGALNAASRARRRRPRAPALGFAGAFATAAVALVIVLVAVPAAPRRRRSPPRGSRSSARPPGPSGLVGRRHDDRVPGLVRPRLGSAGMRSDKLGGRAVTTEFYSSYEAGTIGYAIVSGSPLRWGAGGRVVARDGGTTGRSPAAARGSSPGSRTATRACSPRGPHRRRRWCAWPSRRTAVRPSDRVACAAMESELACIDGQLVPQAQAVIPVTDLGLLRGDGVFEVIRLYGGRPYALDAHLAAASSAPPPGCSCRSTVDAIRSDVAALIGARARETCWCACCDARRAPHRPDRADAGEPTVARARAGHLRAGAPARRHQVAVLRRKTCSPRGSLARPTPTTRCL